MKFSLKFLLRCNSYYLSCSKTTRLIEKKNLFCEFNLEYSTKKLPLDDDRVLYRNGYCVG